MANVKVDSVKFLQRLGRRINKAQHGRNRVMRVMGAHQLRSTALNFNGKGRKDAETGVWPPLAEVTIAQRRKGQRKNPMPLVRTGVLKNSITFRVDESLNQSTLVVGTNVPYAKYHQQDGEMDGAPGKGKLPKRPFLRFHRQDVEFFKAMCIKEFGSSRGAE